MSLLADIAHSIRRLIEDQEEEGEYSGGFLPYRIRLKAVSLVSENGSLLDIGCGEGLFLRRIPEIYHKKLFGLDPWEILIRRAQEKVSVPLFIGNGNALPFKKDTFNEITILNLFPNLIHFHHMIPILKEALRVCKKGGKVIFDYRNKKNPLIWLGYKTVKIHDPDIKVPLHAYPRRQVKRLLQTVGAEGVHYHPIPSWWRIDSPAYVVEIRKNT